MLISRALVCSKRLTALLRPNPKVSNQAIRYSSEEVGNYRNLYQPQSKGELLYAEIIGGVMWWWILWHIFTEPEHLIGEFPYPDPSKWTDEELGIPPDHED